MTESQTERNNKFKDLREKCERYVRRKCKFLSAADMEDIVQECMISSLGIEGEARTDALHYIAWERDIIDKVYRKPHRDEVEAEDTWMRGSAVNPEKVAEVESMLALIKDDRVIKYLTGEVETLREAFGGEFQTQDYVKFVPVVKQALAELGIEYKDDPEDNDQSTFDFI